jgi:hypothetical protein
MSPQPWGRLIPTATGQGEWRLSLALTTLGSETELTFIQRLTDPKSAGEMGPGWESTWTAWRPRATARRSPNFQTTTPPSAPIA